MENVVYFMQTQSPALSQTAHRLLEWAIGGVARLERTMNGKPYLADRPNLHFNLSHTKGAVACALSDAPVGVDIEGLRPLRQRFAQRYFTIAEQQYTQDEARMLAIWTRKEALLKRDGRGITVPLCEIETMAHPDLSSCMIDGYTLSFCGTPSQFRLVTVLENTLDCCCPQDFLIPK